MKEYMQLQCKKSEGKERVMKDKGKEE